MGTAANIRVCRVRAGKSAVELARRLDLNDAWYQDLELHDDELVSTLSLFKAMELASLLGVGLSELAGDDAPVTENIPIAELPLRISEHLEREGISMEQFGERIGWEIDEFMISPIKAAAELPIAFLQAIATAVGFNWLSLVPDPQS